MRPDRLSPLDVLRALELFGPQARPYNFDDCFDCWGLLRRVFDHLDDGFELDDELADEPGGPEEARWAAFTRPDELVAGDLLVSHPHLSTEFHTVVYCGRVAGLDLVYDASPRADVPLFARRDGAWEFQEARAIHTLFGRATEITDRLRWDGGAYLRLWDDRQRYYHTGLRERLEAGAAGDSALEGLGGELERDLVALRRAAGLDELPFYCRRRLPRDGAGRELYDNGQTRGLDYYVPDGAPVPDDEYEAVEAGAQPRRRPPAPRIVTAPAWVVRDGPVLVEWEYRDPAVRGCRVELWEETFDLWKHRLLRLDLDEAATSFSVPADLLHDDSRFAVVVWARARGAFSGPALAPFLYRPGKENRLLAYHPVRPEELAPGAGEEVPVGVPLELSWRIREPLVTQASFHLEVLEDALPVDGEAPVFELEAEGAQARACRASLPGEVLRSGHTYRWYVTARTADGRTAFAPSEGMVRAREG